MWHGATSQAVPQSTQRAKDSGTHREKRSPAYEDPTNKCYSFMEGSVMVHVCFCYFFGDSSALKAQGLKYEAFWYQMAWKPGRNNLRVLGGLKDQTSWAGRDEVRLDGRTCFMDVLTQLFTKICAVCLDPGNSNQKISNHIPKDRVLSKS